jgi:integrase
MGRDDITAHGFRSTFADWVSECTNFPDRVREAALAHVIGSKSARSYARSDLLAERAKLMSMWADFCYGPPIDAADVVPIRRARP